MRDFLSRFLAGQESTLYEPLRDWWVGHGLPAGVLAVAWGVLVAAAVVAFVLVTVLALVWLERKVSGDIQSRLGPARVGGRFGVLQTAADALKLLLKEDIIPARADRALFVLAPLVTFLPAIMVFVVLPFARRWVPADLDVGVLYVIAISSLPALGMMMAGWGSNNKYALLGGMRAVAQLMAYEVPLVLAVLNVAAYTGTLSTVGIVEAQRTGWFIWNPALAPSFLIFFVAALAEVNRVPFDLPEAEAELVAGYHTEYSGMRFALFFLGEYTYLFFVCAFGATLFLGGWQGPLLPPAVWLVAKSYALVLAMMWVRWTLPRLRIDQLLSFGWKLLLPLALANLVFTAFWAVR